MIWVSLFVICDIWTCYLIYACFVWWVKLCILFLCLFVLYTVMVAGRHEWYAYMCCSYSWMENANGIRGCVIDIQKGVMNVNSIIWFTREMNVNNIIRFTWGWTWITNHDSQGWLTWITTFHIGEHEYRLFCIRGRRRVRMVDHVLWYKWCVCICLLLCIRSLKKGSMNSI